MAYLPKEMAAELIREDPFTTLEDLEAVRQGLCDQRRRARGRRRFDLRADLQPAKRSSPPVVTGLRRAWTGNLEPNAPEVLESAGKISDAMGYRP
jgi:hypothetical protein